MPSCFVLKIDKLKRDGWLWQFVDYKNLFQKMTIGNLNNFKDESY